MSVVHRVLDANINRAAEGMRVLEDIARFIIEDQKLCSSIKNCRHQLRTQTQHYSSRDVCGDVGTTVSTKEEGARNSVNDVAIAAGNRCAEALRVIEEFLKLEHQKNTVESIRYEMYDLSAEVIRLLGATNKQQWKLCFIMTKDECVLAWQDTLIQSIAAGCDCVQVREKELATRDLIKHVKEVKKIADKYGAQVIVNDRVDVLLATGSSGVHLGKNDMSTKEARKLLGSEYIIGKTVHAKGDLTGDADYIGVGAMFASKTKPEVQTVSLGLLKNALAYRHLAIGGITPENVNQLYAAGCKGIAVSSAIAHSNTPEKIVAALLQPEHQSA
jgi:thiamine-phosphate pyrophosphorylase